MPGAEVLLDSNVLVYAMTDAQAERPKRDRAIQLISEKHFGTSYQVLMETWVVATRKMKDPVETSKVAAFLERILEFPCVFGTPGLYRQAYALCRRYRVHPYDAAILAAAKELGAVIVYTEDLNDGQDYDGVQAINPFGDLA